MSTKFPILLVDDQPGVADSLQQAAKLIFPQAQFVGLSSFEEAVAYIATLSGAGPRLVLLDPDLPGGRSGLDFLTLLRHHPQGAILPIVVLSNQLSRDTKEEAYRRGANAVTGKALNVEEWTLYVQQLRSFWFETATTPHLYFEATTADLNR